MREKHWLSSSCYKRVQEFGPKFVVPFNVLEVVNNNFITDVEGEKKQLNLAQVRVRKFIDDSESSRTANTYSPITYV